MCVCLCVYGMCVCLCVCVSVCVYVSVCTYVHMYSTVRTYNFVALCWNVCVFGLDNISMYHPHRNSKVCNN